MKAVSAAPGAPQAIQAPKGSETYNVFLSQITSDARRDEAVKLICEIRKCSEEEARELTTRSIIPLLKEVPKAEAERALQRFRIIKVAGRMTLSKKQ
jgi:ribosomal protein L7/L12